MDRRIIVFTEPGKAELQVQPVREPNENEVVVRLHRTTVSAGTERANLMGSDTLSYGRPPEKATYPRTIGYAGGGEVVAIGSRVTKVKVGDRVVARWGQHADYVVLPETNVTKLPDEISYSEASLSFIATFSMAGVRKTQIELGESGIVMGMGILGLFSVMFMKAAGAVPVIAVDPVEERRKLALEVGADYALNPFEEGFAAKVKELTGGGANAAVEVTGSGKALDQVLDCMARFGVVSLLGCTRSSDFTIDYYRKVHGPGVTLVGAHTVARPDRESSRDWWTYDDEHKAMFKLIQGGRISFDKIVSEVHAPSDATEVYDRLASGNFPIGVQFDWTK